MLDSDWPEGRDLFSLKRQVDNNVVVWNVFIITTCTDARYLKYYII